MNLSHLLPTSTSILITLAEVEVISGQIEGWVDMPGSGFLHAASLSPFFPLSHWPERADPQLAACDWRALFGVRGKAALAPISVGRPSDCLNLDLLLPVSAPAH